MKMNYINKVKYSFSVVTVLLTSPFLLTPTEGQGAEMSVSRLMGAEGVSVEGLLSPAAARPSRDLQRQIDQSIALGEIQDEFYSLSSSSTEEQELVEEALKSPPVKPVALPTPKAKPQKADNQDAPADSNAHSLAQLQISLRSHGVGVSRSRIDLEMIGSHLSYKVLPDSTALDNAEQPQIFMRDNSVATIDSRQNRFVAIQDGKTELYVVFKGNMVIVPVSVGQGGTPDEDERIKSISGHVVAVAPKQQVAPVRGEPEEPRLGTENIYVAATPGGAYTPSMSPSQAAMQRMKSEELMRGYHWQPSLSGTKRVTFQVIDERSVPESNQIFPVAGIHVQLVGAAYTAQTGVQGQVQFDGIPRGGRLLVKAISLDGSYLPSLLEVKTTPDAAEEKIFLRVLSERSFLLNSTVFDQTQRSDSGSICGRLVPDKDTRLPVEGLQISLNAESSGAFYFNEFTPSGSLAETDRFGKFCIFNVKPGLVDLAIKRANQVLATTSLYVLPGHHIEKDININVIGDFKIETMGIAYDIESSSSRVSRIDYAGLELVGFNGEKLDLESHGVLRVDEEKLSIDDRVLVLNNSPEFESALFSYELDRTGVHVAPLLQRGFVEDMVRELEEGDAPNSQVYDDSLGSLIVFMPSARSSEVTGTAEHNLKLISASGELVEGGWFFGANENGFSKALFYNLTPGVYTLISEDATGAWNSVQTVIIDFWTTSVAMVDGNFTSSH
jgi:hypothetical protein